VRLVDMMLVKTRECTLAAAAMSLRGKHNLNAFKSALHLDSQSIAHDQFMWNSSD
jgi:hypothetical protein